jgi:Ca2+-transporting ATPase
MIAGTTAVVQVLLTSFAPLASIFKVEPLGLADWAVIIAGTASVLVFAEVWRQVRLRMG